MPNELDAVALSDDTDFEKLNKVRDILIIYFTNEMKVTMLHVGTNTLFNISCKFIIYYVT